LYVAFSTNVVILLHICWGVLWFDGWEHRGLRGWLQIILTFISHMLVAGLVSLGLCVSVQFKKLWGRDVTTYIDYEHFKADLI